MTLKFNNIQAFIKFLNKQKKLNNKDSYYNIDYKNLSGKISVDVKNTDWVYDYYMTQGELMYLPADEMIEFLNERLQHEN